MKSHREYRNRRAEIRFDQVTLDDAGNIIKMPPTPNLACFGDPIEYHHGLFSRPRVFVLRDGTTTESSKGCYGCRSRTACALIATHRVAADPQLTEMHENWSDETRRLEPDDRYQHLSFQSFAAACRLRGWTSSNEATLAKKRKADAKRRRRTTALAKRTARRHRPATPEFLAALEDGYARRIQSLRDASENPSSGQWLKKLDDRSVLLTCDIWRMDELLKWELREEATGSEIARRLISADQHQGRTEHAMRSRVSETRQRIDRLEVEATGLSAWQSFQAESEDSTPCKPTSSARDLYVFIDDDFDDKPSIQPRANCVRQNPIKTPNTL